MIINLSDLSNAQQEFLLSVRSDEYGLAVQTVGGANTARALMRKGYLTYDETIGRYLFTQAGGRAVSILRNDALLGHLTYQL